MLQNYLALLFAYLAAFRLMAQIALEVLNGTYGQVLSHHPEKIAAQLEIPTTLYLQSVAYTNAKRKLKLVEDCIHCAVFVLIILSAVIPTAFGGLTGIIGTGLIGQACAFMILLAALSLIDLPLEFYRIFKIEAAFGFNKQTISAWIVDQLKGAVLGGALGFCVILGLLKFYAWQPSRGWIVAWCALAALQLFLLLAYPRLILPIFNKLSPLPEGPLRTQLLDLAQRAGFGMARIDVIDGSKRSSHSNALFTGFGRWRRIILFDTLIEQLPPQELCAVLAHEIGHYKKGHVVKMLLISLITSAVGLFILWWGLGNPTILTQLGLTTVGLAAVGPALILFSLIVGIVGFWIKPLLSFLSQRYEYEADAFAAEVADARALMHALDKLHEKNLSNFTPHPTYSRFYYSHPTLQERKIALRAFVNN